MTNMRLLCVKDFVNKDGKYSFFKNESYLVSKIYLKYIMIRYNNSLSYGFTKKHVENGKYFIGDYFAINPDETRFVITEKYPHRFFK